MKFTFFDWIIVVGGIILVLLFAPIFFIATFFIITNLIFSGITPPTGAPWGEFLARGFWTAIGFAALWTKWQKWRKSKSIKDILIEKNSE